MWQTFKRSKIGTVCSDPVVAFAVSVFSIVFALGTSYCFYGLASRERNLIYYINPNVTTILEPGTLADLAVSYHGFQITNGLYSVQIAIWNKGNEPIEDMDILRPISIKAPKGVQVIQRSIATVSRDVTNLHFVGGSAPDRIEISWRILEQNDGAVLQLFYTGRPEAGFIVDGVIKEQHNLNAFTNETAGLSKLFIERLAICIICLLALLGYWFLFFFSTRHYASYYLSIKRVRYYMAAITLFLILLVIFSCHQLFHTQVRNTPFGF
jgi:hypothetical protein